MKLVTLFDGFGSDAVVAFDKVNMDELRSRNEQRIKVAKEKMGTRYLLHPANRVQKRKEPRL